MVLLLLVLLGTVAQDPTKAIEFETRFRRDKDSLQAVPGKGQIELNITSASGIGDMQITPTQGQWPKHVVVLMKLGSLEYFSVDNGKVKLTGSIGFGDSAVVSLNEKGEPTRKGEKAHYTMHFRKRGPRLIEVRLPPGLATEQNTLNMYWIDAYRR